MKHIIVIAIIIIMNPLFLFSEDAAFIEALTDKATISVDKEEFEAEGGLRLKYEDIQVTANKIKKIPDKNIIIAYDNVLFKKGETIVEADSVEVNLDDKSAKISNGKSSTKFGEGMIYYAGKEIKAKYPFEATVKNSSFSTCDLDKPHYHLQTKKIKLYPEVAEGNKENNDNNRDGDDDRIIAYNSILYIGKIPVFWLPYYISSLSDQNACLFPRFGKDSETGWFVKWGTQYRFNRQYLKGYANMQWSEKKGWIIDGKDNYYFTPENKGNLLLTKYLIPKNGVDPEWDWSWHHDADIKAVAPKDKNKTPIMRNGNWKADYQNQTTNQLKTSSGTAIDKIIKKDDIKGKNTLQKAELKIDQNWLKDINTYVYIKYVNNKSLLKDIINVNAVTTSYSAANISDNELQNEYRYTQNNNNYKLILHYDDFKDLDPGYKGDTNTYKKTKDGEIELKMVKVNFKYINTKYDQWGATSFDTANIYDKWWITKDYHTEETYTLGLGSYPIFKTGFNTGISFEQTKYEDRTRDYSKYTYLNTEDVFENNPDSIKYDVTDKNETSKSATLKLNNSSIDLFVFGKLNSTYEHMWKQHLTGEIEHKQTYGETITTTMYDNNWDDEREYDLKVENIITATHVSSYGKRPKKEKLDDTQRSISEAIKIYLGNMELKDAIMYKDTFWDTSDIKKSEEISNESSYLVGKDRGNLKITEHKDYSLEKFRIGKNNSYVYTTTIDGKPYELSYTNNKVYDQEIGKYKEKGLTETAKGTFPVDKFKLTYSRQKTLGRSISGGAIIVSSEALAQTYIINFDNGHKIYNTISELQYQSNDDILKKRKGDSNVVFNFNYKDISANKKYEEAKKEEIVKEEKKLKLSVEEVLEADRLLREEEAKKRRVSFGDFMSLGNEKKDLPLDETKSYTLYLNYTIDEEYLKKQDFNFENYEKSFKGFSISNTFKYSNKIVLTLQNKYSRTKGGTSKTAKSSGQTLAFTLGPNDYFWTIKLKRERDDFNKYDTSRGIEVEHNIHCTNMALTYNYTKASKDAKRAGWEVGFNFKMNAFPTKQLKRKMGKDAAGKSTSNTEMGI